MTPDSTRPYADRASWRSSLIIRGLPPVEIVVNGPDCVSVKIGGDAIIFESLEHIAAWSRTLTALATAQLPADRGIRHTPKDEAALIAAGVDPSTTQPREQEITCGMCSTKTLNVAGGCDNPRHYLEPAAVYRASVRAEVAS